MVRGDTEQRLEDPKGTLKEPNPVEIGTSVDSMFSPRFKSVVAMAGWDEEALLIATLVVEDTPERELKQKKRSDLHFKTPPTNSRRKRRIQRKSPTSIPITVLNLDEDEEVIREDCGKKKAEQKISSKEEKKIEEEELLSKTSDVSFSSSSIPCMDKLREELSCAICLEICFEPSTTPCGHSFCKKCLRSAADKCGKKCPKCRQLVSNGRSCTVNTVLWNTIQLLFPQEIEARKAAGYLNSRESEHQSPGRVGQNDAQNRSVRPPRVSSRDASLRNRREAVRHSPESRSNSDVRNRNNRPVRVASTDAVRRRGVPSQDRDAALALRLQREEFMEAFRGSSEQTTSALSLARENLRAMASRAMDLRLRGRPI